MWWKWGLTLAVPGKALESVDEDFRVQSFKTNFLVKITLQNLKLVKIRRGHGQWSQTHPLLVKNPPPYGGVLNRGF